MEPIREEDTEFLSSLEERILKAVELVAALRKENASLEDKLQTMAGAREAAEASLAESHQEMARLSKEMDSLRAERKHVRTRIEKLLGQMDLLSAG